MSMAWERPRIEVEKFIANEYVAACGDSGVVYKFQCNAGNRNTHYAVKDADGKVATISGMYLNGSRWYYHPCGDTHEAESNSGFLFGYHLDNPNTWKDENIEVIIWTENNTDIHCTTELDMTKWETAKS